MSSPSEAAPFPAEPAARWKPAQVLSGPTKLTCWPEALWSLRAAVEPALKVTMPTLS